LAALCNTVEEEGEEFTEELKKFIVVFFDGHFNIEADELAHMPVGKAIFSSENRTYFKHSLKVSHHTHLLVELR